jgi:hypothetical protein
MTIYKVVGYWVGLDEKWGVQCIPVDGPVNVIGPFDTEAEAHAASEEMAELDAERSA